MIVLIAGATGLVGSALREYLKSKNIEVHYLTRNQSVATSDASAYYWNPKSNIIDKSCFKNVQAIINLAGTRISRPWTKRQKQILIDSRIESTRLLKSSIEKLRSHHIKHFVAASAIGIYCSESTLNQTEVNVKKAKTFLSTLVQKWERESLKLEQNNMTVTIVRFGHIFSNKGGFYPILNTFLLGRIGLIFGQGNQVYSWIHIDDTVQIIHQIIKNQWYGTYNLVAPNSISQKGLAKIIAKHKKHKTWLISISSSLIKIILGERSQLILKGQSVSAQKLVEKGYAFKFPTAELCVENLKVTK